jgi:hypothetical protein
MDAEISKRKDFDIPGTGKVQRTGIQFRYTNTSL